MKNMPSLADRPELIGFFSYSREDDQDSEGALSTLRDRIRRELRSQLGRSAKDFRLFQDKEAIYPGALWHEEIEAAIAQSVFFISIITPRAVVSDYCRFEFEAFRRREQQLARNDLIFPIIYIRVPALEDSSRWQADPLLLMIARRQWVDWREYRHRDVVDGTPIGVAVERLCSTIVETLRRPDIPHAETQRRQQEEAERRQAQAEAEHREREQAEKRHQRRAQAEAEQRERQQANKQHQQEERRRTQAEAEQRERAEAERRQQQEEQRRAQAEAEQRERAEAVRRRQQEGERARAHEAAERQGRADEASRPAEAGARQRRRMAFAIGAAIALLLIVAGVVREWPTPSPQMPSSPAPSPQTQPAQEDAARQATAQEAAARAAAAQQAAAQEAAARQAAAQQAAAQQAAAQQAAAQEAAARQAAAQQAAAQEAAAQEAGARAAAAQQAAAQQAAAQQAAAQQAAAPQAAAQQAAARAAAAREAAAQQAAALQEQIQKAQALLGLSATTARRTWTTGACSNPSQTYSAEIRDGNLIWTSGDGSTDTERIELSADSSLRTTTTNSVHVRGKPEKIGTEWSYYGENNTIMVNRDNRPAFSLLKCQ